MRKVYSMQSRIVSLLIIIIVLLILSSCSQNNSKNTTNGITTNDITTNDITTNKVEEVPIVTTTNSGDSETEAQVVLGPTSTEKDELYFDNYSIRWGMSAEEITDTLHTYKNYHDYGSKIKGESSYYLYKDQTIRIEKQSFA